MRGETVHQLIDVLRRILHAVRPVLQIEVDADALAGSIFQLLTNVADMLFGSLVKLLRAVFQRALRQQVHHTPTTIVNPIYRLSAVDESKHLYPIQTSYLAGIATYLGDCFALTFRDACRSHLDAIDVQVVKQLSRHHHLFVRQKRHTIGLLAVAQRRVHNLDERRNALVGIYLFSCSLT